MNEIVSISEWLKTLRDAGPQIAAAGTHAGAAKAREQGFTAQERGTVVSVNFRGRRPITGVDRAMTQGMLVEFDRRKK